MTGSVLSSTTQKAALPVRIRWRQSDADGTCRRDNEYVFIGSAGYVLVRDEYPSISPAATEYRTKIRASSFTESGMDTWDCAGNKTFYWHDFQTSLGQPEWQSPTPAGWRKVSNSGLSAGAALRSTGAGARYSVDFYGTVGVVMSYLPGGGSVRVLIDGTCVATVSTSKPTKKNMVVAYQKAFASYEFHSLRWKPSPTRP